MAAVAQLAEHLVVVQERAGSIPVGRPKERCGLNGQSVSILIGASTPISSL